jgi:hypothetical protein
LFIATSVLAAVRFVRLVPIIKALFACGIMTTCDRLLPIIARQVCRLLLGLSTSSRRRLELVGLVSSLLFLLLALFVLLTFQLAAELPFGMFGIVPGPALRHLFWREHFLDLLGYPLGIHQRRTISQSTVTALDFLGLGRLGLATSTGCIAQPMRFIMK